MAQGLIKVKVALEDESRREEGNERYPGLLVSWRCRSVTVWMEMRAKNYNYGSECSRLGCGCGEDRAHLNYCWSSDLGQNQLWMWGNPKFPDFSTSQGSVELPFPDLKAVDVALGGKG